MSDVLKQRDFLKEIDFTRDELQHLIDLAAELKAAKRAGPNGAPSPVGRLR